LTLERVVRPAGPYTLALSTRHASDATRHLRDGTLTTALRVGDRSEVGSARQTVDGRLVLRAETDEGFERLRFLLAVDADHTEFLRRFARDPLIGEATVRFQGMRQLRLPTVAQTLLRAFCGQLIESREARRLECRIVRATTPRLEGTDLHEPPTAASFAGLAPARLRQLGLHARRAAALVRICRSVDLERLHTVPTADAAAFIERQRGLGPWSAGVVCLEGLGRNERGLVGDLTLIKLMSALRGRWVEGYETAELLEPYGEWAGLAGLYLATAFAHGLISVPEPRAAQPRPAFA
jgi:DNA-3-methyladenine glycosylase II/AraC family transcriptional regulator of adaptative response / DNA-3-methyladenine glycosylase II